MIGTEPREQIVGLVLHRDLRQHADRFGLAKSCTERGEIQRAGWRRGPCSNTCRRLGACGRRCHRRRCGSGRRRFWSRSCGRASGTGFACRGVGLRRRRAVQRGASRCREAHRSDRALPHRAATHHATGGLRRACDRRRRQSPEPSDETRDVQRGFTRGVNRSLSAFDLRGARGRYATALNASRDPAQRA